MNDARQAKRTQAMPYATVLGNGDGALGVIHALVRAGITVRHVYTNPGDCAHRSRFIRHAISAPAPDQGTALRDCLIEIGDQRPGSFLIPCNDASVLYVSLHRDALLNCFAMTVPTVTVLNQIIDKSVLYRRAIELGVPVPKTWFPDSVENLRDVSRRVAYPCLLKPAVSHRFFAAYGKKLVVASDRDGLESAFTDAHARGIVTLVSEIVEGDDTCLFHYRSYLDGGGRVLAELCTRKIRQHPAGFGVASFSRTIPMIGAIRAHTLSLLRHAGYRGVSSAEFKRDARDGQFKLLEINARPVLPERLFAEAGVNFSQIGYRDAVQNRAAGRGRRRRSFDDSSPAKCPDR